MVIFKSYRLASETQLESGELPMCMSLGAHAHDVLFPIPHY